MCPRYLNHCFVIVFTDFDKMTITACRCSMLPVRVPYQLDEIYPTPTIMQRISQSLLFYHLSFNLQRSENNSSNLVLS